MRRPDMGGNAPLSGSVTATPLVLLFVQGATLLRMGHLITVHVVVGLVLIGPVEPQWRNRDVGCSGERSWAASSRARSSLVFQLPTFGSWTPRAHIQSDLVPGREGAGCEAAPAGTADRREPEPTWLAR